MANVRIEAATKVFPDGEVAVREVDLDVDDGEFLVIVGPSGSGKSTLLRLVAGLETLTGGRILLEGEDVSDRPPQRRDLAMVFQSYALYPHKTARENLEFGLRTRGADGERIRRRVEEVARTLEIEELLERRPAELSGGQQQRVALGRAIAREPKAFLLDEPLSNLDPGLRVRTRTELARLQRQLGATVLYVTHDQEEAMTLGRRVAVLDGGVLQQLAPPEELYRRPENRFVARFIGSPSMNLLPCRVRAEGSGPTLELEGGGIRLGDLAGPDRRALERAGVGRIELGVRPQDVELVERTGSERRADEPGETTAPAGDVDAAGSVELVESLGSETRLHVVLAGRHDTTVVAVTPGDTPITTGERVALRFRRDRLHLFRTDEGTRIET